eukprot:Platyproteum_vivax@DN6711_c0_g1_i1.p1
MIIDLIVLCVFFTEIILKSIAFGQPFLCDPWNILDFATILTAIVLSSLTLALNVDVLENLFRIPGVLRLLRVIIIFRKLSDSTAKLDRIRLSTFDWSLRSPIDKVITILRLLRKHRGLSRQTRLDIDQCWHIIASGQLYEPVFEDPCGPLMAETNAWLSTAVARKLIRVSADRKGGPAKRGWPRERSSVSTNDTSDLKKIDDKGEKGEGGKMRWGSARSDEMKVRLVLDNMEKWGFDVWELDRESEGNSLVCLATKILKDTELYQELDIAWHVWEAFIVKVQASYLDNTYHNRVHAADVMHAAYWMCYVADMNAQCNLNRFDILAMLVGAAIHDYGHPGKNNVFLVKTKDNLAVRYNDQAVLENFHVASVFKLVRKDPSCNIFQNLSASRYATLRETLIQLVLGTDMTQHFTQLAKLNLKVHDTSCYFMEKELSAEDKNLTMSVVLHACDVSNPAKPLNVGLDWTKRVMAEFFEQGDAEAMLSLPISMLMDRKTTNIAKAQMGFIDVIVDPLYCVIHKFLPRIDECCFYLGATREFWASQVDDMAKEMESGEQRVPQAPPNYQPNFKRKGTFPSLVRFATAKSFSPSRKVSRAMSRLSPA